MNESPPSWFADAMLEVESTGFLADADGPDVDEHWQTWRRAGRASQAATLDAVLFLLSLDTERFWLLDAAELRPVPERELTSGWLRKLAAISDGHLEVESAQEIWIRRGLLRRHTLVRIVYRANDATLTASIEPDRVGFGVPDLLALGNAALTHGSFVVVDRQLICWADDKTQRRLESIGLTVTPSPSTLSIARDGTLRNTAPVAVEAPTRFEDLERAEAATKPRRQVSLSALNKPAWRPKVTAGETGDTVDKFGGCPWLPARTRMPRCPRCKGPMFLALQLRVRSLPLALDVDGVLQVFLCGGPEASDCFIDNEGFVVRLETREIKPREGETERMHKPLAIVGWDELSDSPGPYDLPDDLDEEDIDEDELDDGPAGGDKCGGYGVYAQTGQPRCIYPGCKDGQLVFQLESSWDGLLENVYFGDAGKLFIYVCTAHDEPRATAHIEYS